MTTAKTNEIPYKIYLEENEMPKEWYNVRADMKNKPAPLLNPGTHEPMKAEELEQVFCKELVKQELDNDTPYIEIPKEVRDFYKMYRPSPLVRAYCLEEKLGTPAHIYYKYEGGNTSGSHKLNSAIAQAYYAKKQGLKGVTTENISVFYNPYMFLFVFYIYCAYYCCSNVCLKFELCISMKRDKSSLRSSTCGATWDSRPCSRTGTTRTSSSGC